MIAYTRWIIIPFRSFAHFIHREEVRSRNIRSKHSIKQSYKTGVKIQQARKSDVYHYNDSDDGQTREDEV